MADILTRLEDQLEDTYNRAREIISARYGAANWEDYHFFLGYLQAIRDVGGMIKKIRNPAAPEETGEISNIFEGSKE
jgi:hypothetical protein